MEEKVLILATSSEDAELMAENAAAIGVAVKGKKVWDGPVPPNSYVWIGYNMRMSTPEFYLFRQCNSLPYDEAVMIAAEMFSHFRTWLTCHNEERGYIEDIEYPRTSMDIMLEYLKGYEETDEGRKAIEVIGVGQQFVPTLERVLGTML